ncbi:LCP family protein [Actinoalloteichus hymeniacidonis]|uniref:Transcriptional attenuator, LytR family n=1 Tax=Actinoalloteichus hymeniacidonis TaxID=340345 RepID=A0AAC9HUB0_9PSEU|nr:LCP family protein [Actinoalloteichus hymeniacidonis]AOS65469.1 transcriptional attenuator, LytR family [Actinoalloteichus hymeniacidonis]MBB5906444.1 LCP family protein required for cell wall assembly [Actinoalloteichus hymeniacidonis]
MPRKQEDVDEPDNESGGPSAHDENHHTEQPDELGRPDSDGSSATGEVEADGPAAAAEAESDQRDRAEETSEDSAEAVASPALTKRRRRSTGATVLLAGGRSLVALVSVAVLGLTGYAWAGMDRVQDSINTTSALSDLDRIDIDPYPVEPAPESSSAPPPPPVEDTATDILLVGTDSRTDAQGRPLPEHILRQLRTEAEVGLNTDTIIVLRIPDDGSAAYAVSIPRDTYVPVPGLGDEKINGALGLVKTQSARQLRAEGVTDRAQVERESTDAGRRALIGAVGDLTGARIDHYAEVNLYGFYLFTEAIGGIDVCLNYATSDSDSGANFAAGPQTISGGDALSFVRQRNLPGGDLDRIVRQQVFLAALVDKVLSTGTLTDPGRLQNLLDAMQASLVLDEELDPLVFARQLQGVAGGDVTFVTIPVREVGVINDKGQSVVLVDRGEVRDYVTDLTESDAEGQPVGMSGAGAPPAIDPAVVSPVSAAPVGLGSKVRTQTPDGEEPITADGVPCVN